MEPAQSPLEEIKIRYILYTKVRNVEQIPKLNGDWWVQFEGSWESLHFGSKQPFDIGDTVKITFEKVTADDQRPTS